MAAPASPRAAILPPTPCTIYLCTPPAHPYQCTFYALSRADTVAHLLSSHAEIGSYRVAYGDVGLRSLPVKAVLHEPSAGDDAEHIFVCFCCRVFFPLESTLLHHLSANGLATNITDLIGEEGLRNWVRQHCRRRLAVIAAPAAAAAVDPAQGLLQRFLAPPVHINVHNNYRAVNFNGPCHVAEPAAPGGVPIRLFFTWPLTRANPLIHLSAPSVAALQALVAGEYGRVVGAAEAAAVDWDARMARGLVVRYDKRGGGGGACVVRCDADLQSVWGEVEFAEVFVGDRRSGPVGAGDRG